MVALASARVTVVLSPCVCIVTGWVRGRPPCVRAELCWCLVRYGRGRRPALWLLACWVCRSCCWCSRHSRVPVAPWPLCCGGQLIGAGLALLCQTLVWPLAQSGWQMVWMLLPFALMGGLVFAHKRTAAGAMDTNMAMFILLAPHFPDAAGWGQHFSMALAVVSGPALAWVVYRWVYPTNAQRRMQTLARMMVQEVPALAQRLLDEGKPALWSVRSEAGSGVWHAQLHHRLLRLMRWADKTRWPERAALPRMGLSLRAMQTALLDLQQWRRNTICATPALRRTERLAEVALRRTVEWGKAGGSYSPAAGEKARAAWQALASQGTLPYALAVQLQCVAQRDLPLLDTVRQWLR